MSDQLHKQIGELKELVEISIQQKSASDSTMLKRMIDVESKVDIIIAHPIFVAWEQGKIAYKVLKWGGIILIAFSTFIIAIKNGGIVIKDVIKYLIGIK